MSSLWPLFLRGDTMRAIEDFFAADNSMKTFKSILLIASVPRPKGTPMHCCQCHGMVGWLEGLKKRMPHLKKAGAPGPRSTSSRLLSSSFFPPSLPPTTDCCSVFLLLCLSALSQQVTSSVTRGSCIAPQKRALPPRPLCSSLVCSYFKSHNS